MKRIFALIIALAFLVPMVAHAEFGMGKYMKKDVYDADRDGVIDPGAGGGGASTSGTNTWTANQTFDSATTPVAIFHGTGVSSCAATGSGVSMPNATIARLHFPDNTAQTTAATLTAAGNNTFTGTDTFQGGVTIDTLPLFTRDKPISAESGVSIDASGSKDATISIAGNKVLEKSGSGLSLYGTATLTGLNMTRTATPGWVIKLSFP